MSYYITINNYFVSPKESSPQAGTAEGPCQNSPPLAPVNCTQIIDVLRSYPKESLTAGTVTLGTKKYLRLSWADQIKALSKACEEYGKINSTEFVAFIEATKNQVPHLHMLIYNGYQSRFINHFKKFGARNAHNESFKQVSNVNSYIKYIMKEYHRGDKYFTNMIGPKYSTDAPEKIPWGS